MKGFLMKCPVCNHSDSRVLDSRPIEDGSSIKRRRECPSCGKRFTTYEVVDTVAIAVLKRDGRREFFDSHKLMLGIERACQKRPVNALEIARDIETELQNDLISEITSQDIGEMVLTRLKEVDIVSYIIPGDQQSTGLEGDLSRMIFTKGKKQGLPHKIMCDKPCFDRFAIHNGGHIPSSGLYDYFPKQDSVVT